LVEDTTGQKIRIEQLQEELAKLISEREQIQAHYQRKFDVRLAFLRT
jgi:hypothetical protein